MSKTIAKIVSIIAIITFILSFIPICLGGENTVSYQLLANPDSKITYQLQVSIPQQLNEYFTRQNHRLSSSHDFAKFVTPYALQPVANQLWEIYGNDEDFVNGVLMLVHQITYEETTPGKYPTETMLAGTGDCDLFAYIAASIMKAGGLDVILFYYEAPGHMNLGVNLQNAPVDARGQNYYVEHNNEKYYVAECTGGNWKSGWRVGECPSDYKDASTEIISLESQNNIVYPGQVSASFNLMETSTLSIETSPIILFFDGTLTLEGQLNPTINNQNITIYASNNGSPWQVIGWALTDSEGTFKTTLPVQTGGFCTVEASWSGNNQYMGSVSEAKNAVLLPNYFFLLAGSILFSIGLGIFAFYKTKPKQQPLPISAPISDQGS